MRTRTSCLHGNEYYRLISRHAASNEFYDTVSTADSGYYEHEAIRVGSNPGSAVPLQDRMTGESTTRWTLCLTHA